MYLRSSKGCEMKYLLNAIVIVMFLGTMTFGQVAPKMDPLSIQFDQMKGSITKIIDMVNRQSERLAILESGGESPASIDTLESDVNDTKIKIDSLYENFSKLTDELSRLKAVTEKASQENEILEIRVSELEQIISEIPTPLPGKVKLNADGSATLFYLNGLDGFKSQLPSAEKCAEFGSVLEDKPFRDVNRFFAVNAQDKISVCEFIEDIWQERYSSRNQLGHVVVLSD